MQNRIDRLEGLVLSLMTNGAQSAGPTAAVAAVSRSQSDASAAVEDDDMIKEEDEEDSDVEGVTNSFGVLKVDAEQQKSMYVGDSHWHLVLADVSWHLILSKVSQAAPTTKGRLIVDARLALSLTLMLRLLY